jgi:CheY-like chemotaxis protein
MVVDDEPMNIAVMEALFEELNVKCDSASGGSDAITLARDRLNKVKQG